MPSRHSPYPTGNTRPSSHRRGQSERSPQTTSDTRRSATPPSRNVLLITDLHELQHLADLSNVNAYYHRMLAPRYYTSCGGLERECLYTHITLVPFSELSSITIDNCLTVITNHLLATFMINIDPGTLELRFSDITGDVFQVPRDRTLLDLLEEDRPMWRTHQPEFFANIPIPEDIDYPFIARFSCHVRDPRVILP